MIDYQLKGNPVNASKDDTVIEFKFDPNLTKLSLDENNNIIQLGVSSGITLTATGVGAIAGVPVIATSGLLISIAVTAINEYISKLKERYIRLRTFVNKIRVDYEKVLKKSMADKVIDEKEGLELKKIYDFYLNNQKKIMCETKISVEDIFGDMVENVISKEQLQKLSSFLAKMK